MKKRLSGCLLAFLFILACGAASASSSLIEGIYTFDVQGTKPEDVATIWTCPKSINSDTGYVMDDFVDKLTNAANWPTVLGKTGVLKLYIQQLYTTPEADLVRLANFVRTQKLLVAVELGGIRVAPSGTPAGSIGVTAAASEYQHLLTFIQAGGRVDYITTDHALAAEITGRTSVFPGLSMQQLMQQQMAYFSYMKQRLPNLKMGAIESLGFFWVNAGSRQYQATDGTLNRMDFEYYLSELVRIASLNGIVLDHFHIDFGMHDVEYDGDYGRILAVEDYVHSLGLRSGFIAANAFHTPLLNPAPDAAAATASAAARTLAYFEGYRKAGGRSDYLIFQRWQPYPAAVGTESEPTSCFGIFKSMINSPWFPSPTQVPQIDMASVFQSANWWMSAVTADSGWNGGTMNLKSTVPGGGLAGYFDNVKYGDITLRFRLKMNRTPVWTAVMFRISGDPTTAVPFYHDSYDKYALMLDSNGTIYLSSWKKGMGHQMNLTPGIPSPFADGTEHLVELETRNASSTSVRIRLFVDGALLLEATDDGTPALFGGPAITAPGRIAIHAYLAQEDVLGTALTISPAG